MSEIPPASPDHKTIYAIIGTVASTWSVLERAIDLQLWRLAAISEDAGACLTTQIGSVRNKLISLEALVGVYGGSGELQKSIKRFRSKCETPTKNRNRVVHDPVYADTDFKFLVDRTYFDQVLIRKVDIPDLEDMRRVLKEIVDLINEFETIRLKLPERP